VILMIRGIDCITISSEDSKKLADFYKEKLGLEVEGEFEMGEDGGNVITFNVGGKQNLAIFDHSEIHGKNPQPQRFLINFEVDGDIESKVEKLMTEGVKAVGELHHVEGYGKIMTFEDPDGNYFQLVQVREG
jgi:predicted enzyme related to lactoylglutathione lyase